MKNPNSWLKRFISPVLLFCFFSDLGLTQTDLLKETDLPSPSTMEEPPSAPLPSAIAAPVLKWAYGGCFSSWCQTGWDSSPAVADVNGDGKQEVLWGSYDLVAVSGTDGKLVWRV